MADNYITNPGAGGATFAGDEDAGLVQWPLIKLAWGQLDTFNILADAAGKRLPMALNEINVTVPVSGPLTDAQLRATPVPVSGTVTTNPPANASENVAQFGGSAVLTGVGVSGVGVPRVTVASDSSITANAGTNLNTSALMLDATFTGRINTQGQKAMAASTPVVLASDQASIPVSTKTDLAPSAPTNATVGIASALALAANASRKGLHVRNTSTSGQRMSLSMNGAAVLDSGITLYPQDVFEMAEYDFDQGAINAIASAAAARLSIQEFA